MAYNFVLVPSLLVRPRSILLGHNSESNNLWQRRTLQHFFSLASREAGSDTYTFPDMILLLKVYKSSYSNMIKQLVLFQNCYEMIMKRILIPVLNVSSSSSSQGSTNSDSPSHGFPPNISLYWTLVFVFVSESQSQVSSSHSLQLQLTLK